jgi:peroxiredoxin
MEWHIFPEGRRRHPAPAFRLPSAQGDVVSLDDQRGWDNVVLFFSHGDDCEACQQALREFALRRMQYAAQEAKVFAILPQATERLRDRNYPFPLLADPQRRVYQQYSELLGEDADGQVMLFVLDRYGAPYAAVVRRESDGDDMHDEALRWLDYIQLQCPE